MRGILGASEGTEMLAGYWLTRFGLILLNLLAHTLFDFVATSLCTYIYFTLATKTSLIALSPMSLLPRVCSSRHPCLMPTRREWLTATKTAILSNTPYIRSKDLYPPT